MPWVVLIELDEAIAVGEEGDMDDDVEDLDDDVDAIDTKRKIFICNSVSSSLQNYHKPMLHKMHGKQYLITFLLLFE